MAAAFSNIFFSPLLFIFFPTVLLLFYLTKIFLQPQPSGNPPPSPPALPIIGHLHHITPVLVTCFQNLSRRYGPLIEVRIGASSCVVASTAAVAKEILKTNELNFVSRPEFGSSEYFIYRGSRFVLAQYGPYWRFMKKVCMNRLLSASQLNQFVDIREEEVVKMVENIAKNSREGKPTDLSSVANTLTNNIICRMAMSARCSGSENEAEETKDLTKAINELAGKLSIGDVLGPFKVLDFSGTGRKFVATLRRFDGLIEKIMTEHEKKAAIDGGGGRKDLMDILLEIYRDSSAEMKLSRIDIKSFLLDIFMAGTDTSSAAIQWAMGELLNRPESLQKLREEILSVVGPNRLVKESDIPSLPYLRAVVKETLRLHPSAPLIIRECAEDCIINGCLVKSKTRVLINAYAVMRDPDSWTDPDKFLPERFLEGSVERIGEHQMEFKGQNFRYIPFGSGKRGCPGSSMAMLVIPPAVAALVQCFAWNVDGGGEEVDLRPGPGFAAEMASPIVRFPSIDGIRYGSIDVSLDHIMPSQYFLELVGSES